MALIECLQKIDKNSSSLYLAQGNFMSLNGLSQQAIDQLLLAIDREPQSSYIHGILGHEYLSSNQFQLAKESYKQSLIADPSSYFGYWGLGNLSL